MIIDYAQTPIIFMDGQRPTCREFEESVKVLSEKTDKLDIKQKIVSKS